MKDKLIVLSMDAMIGEDVEYLRTKPNFSELMAHSAGVDRVCTIYPSITYPAHVSIMTGCRPGKHGVNTNGALSTEGGATRWHLYSSKLQVEDIFAAAKRQGCSTAAVYWPVTGNNPNIDYLIDEYFFPDASEDIESGFRKLGANDAAISIVRENMDRYPVNYKNRVGKLNKTHTFDHFINGCMCSMIRNLKPDVLFVHNCILDTLRHRYGILNEYVTEGLDQADEWFGEIIQAMKDAGTYEHTNFVILSDHGQMNFARRIKMNYILRKGGFVDVDEQGKVTDWRAFSQSNGMSATIFLKDPEDKETKQKVYDYLKSLLEDGVWGFSKIYTEEEAKAAYGMYGGFAFMVETDGCTAFADGWTAPVVNPIDLTDYRLGMATHGYEPEKGPQPVFEAVGPAFRPDVRIQNGFIINEAPTFAAILGDSLPQAEGKPMTELLK